MMTVAIAQMNLNPVVSLYCSFILLLFVEYHIFLYKYFLNTLLFCSLSAAYPTCFPLTQFTCANGRCININWRCDNGEYHPSLPHLSRCTVESNLRSKCKNLACVRRCTDNDCGDSSDEAGCSHSCSSVQFKCNSGRCIPEYWTCDGDNDCGDYSDETHANCTNQGNLAQTEIALL